MLINQRHQSTTAVSINTDTDTDLHHYTYWKFLYTGKKNLKTNATFKFLPQAPCDSERLSRHVCSTQNCNCISSHSAVSKLRVSFLLVIWCYVLYRCQRIVCDLASYILHWCQRIVCDLVSYVLYRCQRIVCDLASYILHWCQRIVCDLLCFAQVSKNSECRVHHEGDPERFTGCKNQRTNFLQ